MRILIAGRGFDAPGRHEVGVFELDQARALRDAGHDVRFAAVDTRSIRRRRPWGLREYALDGIGIFYCAVPAGARPPALADAAQRLAAETIWRRLEKDGWRPDVVHAHFGAAMLGAARRRGVPTVYTEHLSLANQDEVSPQELKREKSVCAAADRVLCVSHPLSERISRRCGIRTTVVHNIVDAAFARAECVRKTSDGVFRFVSAGSLIRRKGYDLLLRALSMLRGRIDREVFLTIVGDGEEREELASLARSLGLSDSVTFTGQLDRAGMVAHYQSADAFVLASRRETFGVVYIEAMAMGLPVIATACGGPEDFIDDTNGFLVPTEDADALTDAMERMVRGGDGFDRPAIARAARDRFSPKTIAGELTAVYEEVVKC